MCLLCQSRTPSWTCSDSSLSTKNKFSCLFPFISFIKSKILKPINRVERCSGCDSYLMGSVEGTLPSLVWPTNQLGTALNPASSGNQQHYYTPRYQFTREMQAHERRRMGVL